MGYGKAWVKNGGLRVTGREGVTSPLIWVWVRVWVGVRVRVCDGVRAWVRVRRGLKKRGPRVTGGEGVGLGVGGAPFRR